MQLKRYSTDKNLHYLFLQDNKMEGKDKLQVREGSKKNIGCYCGKVL